MIKLIRLSDRAEFIIDGDDKEWRATKIEGIDALAVNVYTETPAIGQGEILTGKHTGRRDINVEAHRSSQKGISKARDTVMEFFNPDDTYTMEIYLNGKHLFIDCELLSYKLPIENIHRPLNLTFTMLCQIPYFYDNEKETSCYSTQSITVKGQVKTTPTILINQRNENEFTIYIDGNQYIRIILDDKYITMSNRVLELDCKYGTLTDLTSKDNLTQCISTDSNPTSELAPGTHVFSKNSCKREKKTGRLTVTSNYSVSVSLGTKPRELYVTYNDGHQAYYDCKQTTYSYSNYSIQISSSGFTFHGPTSSSIEYTAILPDSSSNRSSITIKYKELYRGF